MSFLAVVEHPRTRPARSWVLDALVVLSIIAISVVTILQPRFEDHAAAIVLAVATVLPLVVRRVWPLPVLIWVVALTAVMTVWDVMLVDGLATLVALYTVAALRPRREAISAMVVLQIGALLASFLVDNEVSWFYPFLLLSGLLTAAFGLGLYAGTRKAYLAELRERAEQLERERDQQAELSAAAERARIAREMHDIVAHHLTVMVALSDGAAATAATAPERAAEVMRTVSATGREALADTRRLLGVLRSPDPDDALDRSPLPSLAGLPELVDRVRAAGLPVSLEIQGAAAQALAPGVQLTAYRLIQEALTNTMKHGGSGATASVRVHYLTGELRLDIDDDGGGRRIAGARGAGRGLEGMRERVQAFGGSVESGPASPTGWHVSALLQLDPA